MSILDSIAGFETGVYTVIRRPRGTFVDGIYVPAASTTLSIRAVIQPAREIQRVTAGRDMRERDQNQTVEDVQIIHTVTQIYTRTPTLDPDIIRFEDDDWTVARVEKWPYDGTWFYMGVITRKMDGGS